ncbi:hypothetical protein Dimus_025349 [Dionaea muscipula]
MNVGLSLKESAQLLEESSTRGRWLKLVLLLVQFSPLPPSRLTRLIVPCSFFPVISTQILENPTLGTNLASPNDQIPNPNSFQIGPHIKPWKFAFSCFGHPPPLNC